MKKIVFFSGGIDRSGGTERVLSIIASGLAARDYEVIIVSMCGEKKSHYPLDERIRIYYMEAPGFSKRIIGNIRKLKDIVVKEKPDYWVDVDIILGLYTVFVKNRQKGMKWISWEHFNYYTKFPYYAGLRKFTRRMVCKKSDYLVVLSKEDEGYYRSNEKIKGELLSIPNPSPYEAKESTKEREKTVLAAGRLTAIKGFDMLLEAWSKIENEFPDWKLVIAGEGEEREKLEGMIASMKIKRAELPGFIENMPDMYEKASVFVLSSRNEGFVMVLLEAMSFGLPCVGFGCKAGVKELIIDGKNGFVAEPEDCDDMAEKLRKVMSDEELRKKMCRYSTEHVRSFDIDCILDLWENQIFGK
ncbi:MAG: glycosyltransferase family 4 protein [Lachnospiraceae bacterium]|nr:glycosyltransferase family 4 protein [Lachnospiraceae bacterium]